MNVWKSGFAVLVFLRIAQWHQHNSEVVTQSKGTSYADQNDLQNSIPLLYSIIKLVMVAGSTVKRLNSGESPGQPETE